MQKKILTIVILICLIGIVLFTFIYFKKKTQTVENNVFQAIPTNTAIILELKNFDTFVELLKSDNPVWQDFSQIPFVQTSNSFFRKINSAIKQKPAFASFADNHLFITVQQIGKNKLDYLFFVPLTSEQQGVDSKELIEMAYPNCKITSYEYDKKITIYNLQDDTNAENKIAFAVFKNTLIAGASRISVENSLKNMQDVNNLTTIKSFVKVKKTAGDKVDANLYMNFNQFSNLAYLCVSPEQKK